MSEAARTGVYLRLLGMAIIWGGTFAAARAVALELPHFVAAVLRHVFALAVLVPLLLRSEGGACLAVSRADLARLALLGATGVAGYNALLFAGMAEVPATRASLIVPLNASVTPLLLALAGREPLGPLGLTGIAIAFVGAAIVVSRGEPGLFLSGGIGHGELMLLGCVACWVAYTLIGRTVLARLSPIAATTGAVAFGIMMLAVPAASEIAGDRWLSIRPDQWFELAFLGVFGTAVAFVWYYRGVMAIGAGRAAMFINLVPVFGVAIGALYLGEPLSRSLVFGGMLVVAGLVLLNVRRDARLV